MAPQAEGHMDIGARRGAVRRGARPDSRQSPRLMTRAARVARSITRRRRRRRRHRCASIGSPPSPPTANIGAAVLARAFRARNAAGAKGGRAARAVRGDARMSLKRKYVDDIKSASQLSKILNLGKKSWASQRAITDLACSLRLSPRPSTRELGSRMAGTHCAAHTLRGLPQRDPADLTRRPTVARPTRGAEALSTGHGKHSVVGWGRGVG